jgi:threonine/homoserine/homoserine lactone efflux protein
MTEDALRSFAPLWMMLAYCATPGAVNAEALRRGLRGGFGAALLVQLGAVAGRVVWAALALAGTGTLAGAGPMRFGLAALGAMLILRTAWNTLATPPDHSSALNGSRPVLHGEFAAGFILSLTNPLALVFWSGLGLAGGAVDARAASSMVPSLTAGALIWSVGAAYVVGYGQRAMGHSTLRCAELLTGVALAYFGLHLFWESARSLSSAIGF